LEVVTVAQTIIEPVKKFYRNRIIVASTITASVAVLIISAYINGLGVGNKQAWNWLDVLVFPVVLAVTGIWYQATEADRDKRRQRVQRRREERAVDKQTEVAALESYLDQMGYLLVEKDLRNAPENSDIRALAQARTLTILLRLTPERKRHPLKLVAQMRLINRGDCVIKLPQADLSKADLKEITLVNVDLTDVDLRGANLTDANLSRTVLADADLRNANLKGANLREGNLTNADLRGARSDAATLWRDGFDPETAGVVVE